MFDRDDNSRRRGRQTLVSRQQGRADGDQSIAARAPLEHRESVIKPALKTLIVGLDGSALAERVLPYVSSFAKKLNLAVILLRVFEIPVTLRIRDKDFAEKFAQRKRLLQKEAQEYLEAKAHELGDSEISQIAATVMEGSPASALIDMAEKIEGSMIAVATHGRSGLNRWLMVSVAEKVIHHSGAPVLLVRSS